MAKEICVFCGEKPGMFRSESIIVGKTTQVCCSACAKEVQGMGEAELCRYALSRGYAENRDKIQARLDLLTSAEEARPKCLRCGTPMKFGEVLTLDNTPMRDSFFAGTYDIIPCNCPRCFKIEFYARELLKSDEKLACLYSLDT